MIDGDGINGESNRTSPAPDTQIYLTKDSSSAFSARSFPSSSIVSRADCLVSAETVASDWLRQRRSVSGAALGPFATAAIAFVSDEYGERDSASSLTAFALNSPEYLVPLAMIPSSPIESGEIRNKNQFISMAIVV